MRRFVIYSLESVEVSPGVFEDRTPGYVLDGGYFPAGDGQMVGLADDPPIPATAQDVRAHVDALTLADPDTRQELDSAAKLALANAWLAPRAVLIQADLDAALTAAKERRLAVALRRAARARAILDGIDSADLPDDEDYPA